MRAGDPSRLPTAPLLALVCACSCTLLWTVWAEPPATLAARLVLFQPLWLVRIVRRDHTCAQDLLLFLSLHTISPLLCTASSWSSPSLPSWSPPSLPSFSWHLRHDRLLVHGQVFTLLALCGGLAGSIVLRGQQLKAKESEQPIRAPRIEESWLPPLLIPSRTTHSRLFPRQHSFSYPYLLVGLPIGLQGSVANVLSVDTRPPAWFHVRSRDYLDRSPSARGFAEKLTRYLHAQGVADGDYAFAYLVTAPRFLGYSFNPVSFWYLYDSDTCLKYMVLEVNNTFGERRMYLLKADRGLQPEPLTQHKTFSGEWDKDFHVSPFNSRRGRYSLRAIDPLSAFERQAQVKIDNTIVLRSSGGHPKIVARVWSEGAPREAEHVASAELARFIAGWWWVGLLTFPRILWEAQKLFLGRKLHVWYRPEVSRASVSREFTPEEKVLEHFFRSFLTRAVEKGEQPLRVIYGPPHHDGEERLVLSSPAFTNEHHHSTTVTLTILSPAFYSRFVHYAHAAQAFDRECLAADEKNRTLVIDGASALPILLQCMEHAVPPAPGSKGRKGLLHGLRWSCLRRLRCPPAAASYPQPESRRDAEYDGTAIRSVTFSELDRYVQAVHTDSNLYWQTAIKLFLAERLTFGITMPVVVLDWSARTAMTVAAMAYCDGRCPVWDVLRPRPFHRSDVATSAVALLLANSVHIWSSLKGWP